VQYFLFHWSKCTISSLDLKVIPLCLTLTGSKRLIALLCLFQLIRQRSFLSRGCDSNYEILKQTRIQSLLMCLGERERRLDSIEARVTWEGAKEK